MKFGMIDQENATSLQTIEKGKNELMRLDKFLTEMGLGTRSEVKKILKTKQNSIVFASTVSQTKNVLKVIPL